jgi:hypothetical protein
MTRELFISCLLMVRTKLCYLLLITLLLACPILGQFQDLRRRITVRDLLSPSYTGDSEVLGGWGHLEARLEGLPGLTHRQYVRIRLLVDSTDTAYRSQTRLRETSPDILEFGVLTEEQQGELENNFDSELVSICGDIILAEHVKSMYVGYFYIHTGAFGKYPVIIKAQDGKTHVQVATLKAEFTEFLQIRGGHPFFEKHHLRTRND